MFALVWGASESKHKKKLTRKNLAVDYTSQPHSVRQLRQRLRRKRNMLALKTSQGLQKTNDFSANCSHRGILVPLT